MFPSSFTFNLNGSVHPFNEILVLCILANADKVVGGTDELIARRMKKRWASISRLIFAKDVGQKRQNITETKMPTAKVKKQE